jgi:hypothetical protein
MEIGPVSEVRIAPMVRSKTTDLGLTDVNEIARTSRIEDETYSPSSAAAANGFEDENDDSDALEDDSEELPEDDFKSVLEDDLDADDSDNLMFKAQADGNGQFNYVA